MSELQQDYMHNIYEFVADHNFKCKYKIWGLYPKPFSVTFADQMSSSSHLTPPHTIYMDARLKVELPASTANIIHI